ncbi:MAG TPA: hypothetical protein DHV48_01005 [Prolixibacteraceae bacterium]|nr:hypothetical protein [Prolixibacteraceae bacterium]
MDIGLPEMDGYEARRQIQKFNHKEVLNTQTALALNDDREKCIIVDYYDYISNPFSKNDLLNINLTVVWLLITNTIEILVTLKLVDKVIDRHPEKSRFSASLSNSN